ncbi:hypothetical protein [Allopusillimonas ginsengisoli]|uniref:hypothetical protein n=1 Tax=Allopusillimonas ginsengisoli TaxID=453575 RepID=UPI00143208BE|nr:hypothetical protein [Allopusillimonas ginsengisoli]
MHKLDNPRPAGKYAATRLFFQQVSDLLRRDCKDEYHGKAGKPSLDYWRIVISCVADQGIPLGKQRIPVLGFADYVQRRPIFLFLFCFSETAGGGREASYAVKKQDSQKAASFARRLFCSARWLVTHSGVKSCRTTLMIYEFAKSKN